MHILARSQTKNQNPEFNFYAAKSTMPLECLLCQKGFRFTFIGCTNDGVSCDSVFVLSALTGFLRGEINYTSHTYTNHNHALSRYQLVIGGNNYKNIRIYIIGSGLLKKA